MEIEPMTRQDKESLRYEISGWQVEMLVFEGVNPERQIFLAKRFFLVHNFIEAGKSDVAALSFDDEALVWFSWEGGH